MNAGLSNLFTVRSHLLPATMQADPSFDARLTDFAIGTAAMFELYCSRKFPRVVGDQAILPGDRSSFVLPRYPVEAISLVELKLKDSDAWLAQDPSLIESTSLAAGIIYLPDQTDAGPYWSELRITYTGGYWFETLEPDDDAYPSRAPQGASLLPDDLKMAFLLQLREIWSKSDKLGLGLADKPDAQSAAASLDLSPQVKQILHHYRQFQPI